MGLAEDIAQIARQEQELVLDAFDADVAWRLGTIVRELTVARGQAIVVDIRRFGQPHQQLFYMALAGTTPDNGRWVERKSNTVARFHRSSYAMGLKLEAEGATLTAKYALPDAEVCHAWRRVSTACGKRGPGGLPDGVGVAATGGS